MKKFKEYYIPDKVTFYDFVTEEQAKDNSYCCTCLCGIEQWNDGWDFYSDDRCVHISCCNCVFWENNNLIRAEYFKKLKQSK